MLLSHISYIYVTPEYKISFLYEFNNITSEKKNNLSVYDSINEKQITNNDGKILLSECISLAFTLTFTKNVARTKPET